MVKNRVKNKVKNRVKDTNKYFFLEVGQWEETRHKNLLHSDRNIQVIIFIFYFTIWKFKILVRNSDLTMSE
jgi:hypothetical protein